MVSSIRQRNIAHLPIANPLLPSHLNQCIGLFPFFFFIIIIIFVLVSASNQILDKLPSVYSIVFQEVFFLSVCFFAIVILLDENLTDTESIRNSSCFFLLLFWKCTYTLDAASQCQNRKYILKILFCLAQTRHKLLKKITKTHTHTHLYS